MSIWSEFKRLARPYEDEDDDQFVDDFTPISTRDSAREDRRDRDDRRERGDRFDRTDRFERTDRYDRGDDYAGERRGGNKVVNIHTTTQLQVVLVKPERFENASEIADHLRDKRTVVLNLESTDKNVARRLIDFLSGVAYANEGTVKKVALSTYIITPYNVEILGDLVDELENNGLYF